MTVADDLPEESPRADSPPGDAPARLPAPVGDPDDRAADLRLARLHLRLGSTGLARAELEIAAAAQPLHGAALLDLAEARWRTGDLAAAGVAAQTWLATGEEGLLGSLIAVEAAMADGRPSEARRLLDVLPALAPGALDAAFNGMPRSAVWPAEAGPAPARLDASLGDEGFAPIGAGRATVRAQAQSVEPLAALEAARAVLEAGDAQGAAVRLSVALRLAPHLAPAVLDLLDGASGPMLDLVRGDAYRLVGRETEAERAWQRAAADVAVKAAPRSRRATEPAGPSTSVAIPAATRPVSADPAREPGTPAPESEDPQ